MEFIGGVLLGVLLTFIGELISHKHLKKFYKEEMTVQLRGLLQSIYDEVQVVWDQYELTVGSGLEKLPDGQPFQIIWRASQDYFTVFNTNASSIGKIENSELRSLIIKTYTKAKSLIDSLLLNVEMNQEAAKAELLFLEKKDYFYEAILNNRKESLKQYAPMLKRGHEDLKKLVADLLPKLLKEKDKLKRSSE